MILRETVAVYCKNYAKPINIIFGQSAGFLILKQMVHTATTAL
jgi:hypothetical protein